jgi:hypothetical protein
MEPGGSIFNLSCRESLTSLEAPLENASWPLPHLLYFFKRAMALRQRDFPGCKTARASLPRVLRRLRQPGVS